MSRQDRRKVLARKAFGKIATQIQLIEKLYEPTKIDVYFRFRDPNDPYKMPTDDDWEQIN